MQIISTAWNWLAWVLCTLALSAMPAMAQNSGDGKLIEMAELERLASLADPGEERVTVLLTLLRADVVSASSSVARTFDRPNVPSMQPVSSSHAVFISGTAAVTYEAVRRLRALDEATPEAAPKKRYGSKDSAEIGRELTDGNSAEQVGEKMQSSITFLIAGIAGVAIFAALMMRRMFR
ncbi:MAG: hypothetical protein H8E15_05630 [Planctomycetes bacterium]|nr:hypothetical protein [Planctomycetota bacterium]